MRGSPVAFPISLNGNLTFPVVYGKNLGDILDPFLLHPTSIQQTLPD